MVSGSQGYVGTVAWAGVQIGLSCLPEAWGSERIGEGGGCLEDGAWSHKG